MKCAKATLSMSSKLGLRTAGAGVLGRMACLLVASNSCWRCYMARCKEGRLPLVICHSFVGHRVTNIGACLQGNASSWIQTTIMMEEYLDGPEVDVDLVFSEGQPVSTA